MTSRHISKSHSNIFQSIKEGPRVYYMRGGCKRLLGRINVWLNRFGVSLYYNSTTSKPSTIKESFIFDVGLGYNAGETGMEGQGCLG